MTVERPPRVIRVKQRTMSVPIDTGKYASTAAAIEQVFALHTERHQTVDGATLSWCVECQQDWPCRTVEIVTECFT